MELSFFVADCNSTSGPAGNSANAKPIAVSFSWCSGTPAFKLGGVPKETKKLIFRIIDQQVQSYPHGGGEIAYTGQTSIGCGEVNGGNYQGPSPPPPQIHDYQWTVTAFDGAGNIIGIGRATRKFPE